MSIFQLPIFQFADASGLLVGAKLYSFAGGSTVPKALYHDNLFTSEASNPVIADALGIFPELFMGSGAYRLQMYDRFDNLIATREWVSSEGSGGADIFPIPVNSGYLHYDISTNTYEWVSIQSDHKISLSENDSADYLPNKLKNTNTIKWGIDGDYLRADIDGQLDTYKVKSTSSDNDPDYLGNKIVDSNTINWEIDGSKLKANVSGELDSYKLKVIQEDTIPHYLEYKIAPQSDSINQAVVNDPNFGKQISLSVREDWINPKIDNRATVVVNDAIDSINFPGKIKSSSSDISGYFTDKIKAGTGITINQTEDNVNGTVMHINANNQSVGKVKVNSTDTTADYLGNKLVAGAGMTITPVVSGATTLVLAPVTTYLEDVRSQSNRLNVGSNYPSPQNVCSLVLSSGTWEVEGSIASYVVATTNVGSRLVGNIGNSATIDTDGFDQWSQGAMLVGYDTLWSATSSITIPRRRITVATTRTIYLVAQQGVGPFTVCQMWGNLTARRII